MRVRTFFYRRRDLARGKVFGERKGRGGEYFCPGFPWIKKWNRRGGTTFRKKKHTETSESSAKVALKKKNSKNPKAGGVAVVEETRALGKKYFDKKKASGVWLGGGEVRGCGKTDDAEKAE